MDTDGLVKPVLLVLLEELDRIGIEEICLIISPDEKRIYDDLLMKPVPEELYARLPDKMKEYEDRINRLVRKITFVTQNSPKGFGHAVYQAVSFAGSEPVLLLLGDTIYKSSVPEPCTQQLVSAFENYGRPMVALQSVPLETVDNYGIFGGSWLDEDETVLKCTEVEEKPSRDCAEGRLAVRRGGSEDLYLAAFGAYILTGEVFDRLREMILGNVVGAKGEIEFTTALKAISGDSCLLGFMVNGKSYDLGNARAYRDTVARYPSDDPSEESHI